MTWQLASQAIGVLIAVTSLIVTLVNLANRRTRAYDLADNSLVFIKSLREQPIAGATPEMIETRKVLIERLEERSLYATQLYIGRTKPVLTHQRYAVITFVAFGAYCIYFLVVPAFGLPSDLQQLLALLLVPVGLVVATSMSNRAYEYKRTVEALTDEIGPFVPKRAAELSRLEALRKRVEAVIGAASQP